MALLAGAMCGVRNDSCSRKHKYARTSHGMASESLSSGVDLFFAQEFCFFKQEHGPPRGSKQAKTDVLLTMVLGSLRRKATVRVGKGADGGWGGSKRVHAAAAAAKAAARLAHEQATQRAAEDDLGVWWRVHWQAENYSTVPAV